MKRLDFLDTFTCPSQKIHQDHDDDGTNGDKGKYGVKGGHSWLYVRFCHRIPEVRLG